EIVKDRDAKLGLKFAKAAYDACDGKDPAIVDTYARALYDTGKKDEAIKLEKKAIELLKNAPDQLKDRLEDPLNETLKLYEAGKPAKFEDDEGNTVDESNKDKKKKKNDDDDDDDI